jgi:hypothetical protein
MANLPNHKNRYTGEVIANAVEVCSVCHRNFASTRAGDEHRITLNGKRVCADPGEVGLQLTVNRWGALIYRRPVEAVRVGIRETNRERVSPSKGALLKVS